MSQFSRRTFFFGASAVSLPAWSLRRRPTAAADKLQIASVGVGGKGWSDMNETSKANAHVVAICDVDGERLRKAGEKHPDAKRYRDWRRLLEQKDIDAVTISTPDHMHASIAMAAMALGKHVYVQKPLTHSIFEARQLRLMAERQGVVTQMGNQHRSNVHMKGARALVQAGAIGDVREAHVWTDRPIWAQGMARPSGEDAVPDALDWDLWLGAAPERPFKKGVYHNFSWRGFWDFGTGALGDMGCHLMDPVVWALELGAPTRVSANGPTPHHDTAPKWSIVSYEFPRTARRPAVTMHWYDGGLMPPKRETGAPENFQLPGNGAVFVGSKGSLFVNHNTGPLLWPEDRFAEYERPEIVADDHYLQWNAACRGEGKTCSPFDEAGPLTETVLLGNVAYRLGRPIAWDPIRMEAANARAEAAPLIRRPYREGWEVDWIG